jgi:hypothetical protein
MADNNINDNKERTLLDNIVEFIVLPIFSLDKMINDFVKNIGVVKKEKSTADTTTK